jgi:hypothetical protein
VPAGTAAGYTNGYRWVDLSTPITLTNGQTYVIAANTAQNVDAWPGEWRADFNEVFVGYTALTNRVLVYAPQAAWPTEPSIPVLNNLGSTYGAYNLMSVASATPEVMLTIEKVGANVRLTWPIGVLQQAGAVNGTYTNVPAATSPYTNAASAQQMFFRVKVN